MHGPLVLHRDLIRRLRIFRVGCFILRSISGCRIRFGPLPLYGLGAFLFGFVFRIQSSPKLVNAPTEVLAQLRQALGAEGHM